MYRVSHSKIENRTKFSKTRSDRKVKIMLQLFFSRPLLHTNSHLDTLSILELMTCVIDSLTFSICEFFSCHYFDYSILNLYTTNNIRNCIEKKAVQS